MWVGEQYESSGKIRINHCGTIHGAVPGNYGLGRFEAWSFKEPRKSIYSGFISNQLITGHINNIALTNVSTHITPDPVLEKVLSLDVTFAAGDSELLPELSAIFGEVSTEPTYTLDPAQFGGKFPEISTDAPGLPYFSYRCLPELHLKAFQEYVAQKTIEKNEETPLFGFALLNGVDGTAIAISRPNEIYDYYFVSTTLTESPDGDLGELWISKDSLEQFTVFNSGTAKTAFEWQVRWGVLPKSYFTFDTSTGTITAYDKYGGGVDVVIPEKIAGYPVVAIADEAFEFLHIESLSMVDSKLESTGDSAFSSNEITELVFPATLISIGFSSFAANPLSTIEFGNNLETIGLAAFFIPSGFSSGTVSELVFGDNLTSIGFAAFGGFPVVKITIPANVGITWDDPELPDTADFFTMGIYSDGFRTLYDANPLAGTYEYVGGVWSKTA